MQKSLSNPFNYTGSKYRYLDDIAEILPKDDGLTVCDPFLGGGDLCAHLSESWTVHASDNLKELVEMHKAIQLGLITSDAIKHTCSAHGLDRANADAYLAFRANYNDCIAAGLSVPDRLYCLLSHSNTNRIRFNSDGRFNMPFGQRCFNSSMEKKLNDYQDRLNKRNITFSHGSFELIDFSQYDLVLLDPPYLNTDATYTMGDSWTEKEEALLHRKALQCQRFIYFGQIWSKGKHNQQLDEFAQQHSYKVLKDTTAGCSSNRKKEGATVEVMIWNF